MKPTLVILFLSFIIPGLAQNEPPVSGIVRDSVSGDVLASVSIKVFTNPASFSIISNQEGRFQIRGVEKIDSIRFSMVGYQSKTVSVRSGAQEYIIHLSPNPFLLEEVTVKPTAASEIVRRAIAATAAIIPDKNYSARAFYRESISDRAHYFSIAEAIFLAQYQPAGHSLKLKLEQGRSKEEVSYTRLFEDFHPGGGPQLGAEESFSIRFPDFLNLKKIDWFQFETEKIIYQDNTRIYCIRFDQRPDIKQALEKGRLYVNADDYSIIQYEAENSPRGMPYIKNLTGTDKVFAEILKIDFTRKGWKRKVGFTKADGQLLLSYANIEFQIGYKQPKKNIDLDLNIQIEMAVTDPYLPVEKEIGKDEEWKKKYLAMNLPTAFDSAFWGNRAVISPTEKITDIVGSIAKANQEPASQDVSGWQYVNKGSFIVRQLQDTLILSPVMKSIWEDDATGGMIYKSVEGDFTVESGISLVKNSDSSAVPDRGFQQAGIMIRSGDPDKENYFLLSLGTGGNANPKLFFKRTLDNKTKTVIIREDRLQGMMKIAKTGSKLIAYFKSSGNAEWVKAGEYEIGWLGKKLQVGITAFSHFNGEGPKMVPDIRASFYHLKIDGI